MTNKSPLDDPLYARFAWGRYWRIMRWMFAGTLLVTALVLGVLYMMNGLISVHFYIASAIAVICTLMLTASLMGLVFMSSGSGHDESIQNHLDDDDWNNND